MVHAQPVHGATGGDLLRTDHRHVVLRLAGDHAGVAADALVQVDQHAPAGFAERAASRRRRGRRGRIEGRLLRCHGRLPGDFARQPAGRRLFGLHAVVHLGDRQRYRAVERGEPRTFAPPGFGEAAKRGDIEALAHRHAAHASAAVAGTEFEHVRVLPGRENHRAFDGSAVDLDPYPVAIAQTQAFGLARRDRHRIAPGELAQRPRQLLEPAEIGEAAVPDRLVGADKDLVAARRLDGRQGDRRSRDGHWRRLAALDKAAFERRAPGRFVERLPGFAQLGMAVRRRLAAQQREQFAGAARGMQRFDQWLPEAGRAVGGEAVVPGFQRVAEWQVPVAVRGRFVVVLAGMQAPGQCFQRGREGGLGRRLVRRVAVQGKQALDFTGAERRA